MATMKVQLRNEIGSRKSRRLRDSGQIPGIVYGHGQPSVAVTISEHEMGLALAHGARVLEIDLDGSIENVLIKDVQYDTFGQVILHADLARVNLDERVEVTVPILLRGTPKGAEEGGVLQQIAAEVTIECVVTAIPEEIRVPVAELALGQSLHMSDLKLPEGATLLEDPAAIVCTVSVIAEEEEAAEPAEGGPSEPEVLRERKTEEES